MKTVRLTMAQALVRFLENQYIEVDGEQSRFVRGVFIIPGHGNVVGLGPDTSIVSIVVPVEKVKA